MFQVAEKVVLSLWVESGFVAEVGHAPARGGVPPITLAHNLATTQGVDTVLEQARVAGRRPGRRGARARVGRLHRLLRRPRRLPLGSRLQPRRDRAVCAPVSTDDRADGTSPAGTTTSSASRPPSRRAPSARAAASARC